jgi:hypothetical protein
MEQAQVVSHDGTTIAYERAGNGPAVILVGGGVTDRTENAPLVPVLAEAVGALLTSCPSSRQS